MKRILTIALLSVTVTSLALSQKKVEKTNPNSKVEQEVKQVMADLGKALVARDVAMVERLLADDFTFTQPSSNVTDKARMVEIVKTGSFIYESVEILESKVRIYGQTAVVNGRFNVVGGSNGQSESRQIRFTSVYVKQKGRWQIVALQSNFIPAPSQGSK
jgi:ketosteroid isomerase-like protein